MKKARVETPRSQQIGRTVGNRLGGVAEKFVEALGTVFLGLIGRFLALNAVRCPRYCGNPLGANFFFAMYASSELAFIYPAQGGTNVAQQVRLTVEISNGEFPFSCVLHFI